MRNSKAWRARIKGRPSLQAIPASATGNLRGFAFCSIFLFFSLFASAQQDSKVFLFSYFRGNGEDGLHLAYSLDGLSFTALNEDKSFLKPEVGVSRLMRDPCIIQTSDGTFHMVWTTGWTERGIGYASSQDLITWSKQKYLMVMEKEPAARNCWAPEIVFDEKEKQFLIFWSTTIPGRFPETETSGDNSYNHRIYCTTTKDFESFTETRLFYDKGFNVIDATIISHEKEFVMFVKDETRTPPQKNIRLTRSVSLYGPYSEPSAPLTGQYWAEGPTAARIGKWWYLYFDKYTERKMGVLRSEDLGKWEDISDKASFPEGMRHGTVIETDEKVLSRLVGAAAK
ncbi:MAG: glycoside hydrolase family 43 protein [Bacteroidales bacterium]|jgi:hypothetical protein|nr:glycoside hydrolase family 43 protein [Bacteroidales bacterium]